MRTILDQLPEDLRVRALTHPAFARSREESFERLEFLGDSVLGLIVTEALFRRFPDLAEGELTKVRAAVVSRDACAEVARSNRLGEAMVEQASGRGAAFEATARQLAEQRNALAALTESVLGAAVLAVGYEALAPHALAAFEDRIAWALDNRVDARSQLQELASREGMALAWDELGEDGPPHDRRFTIAVQLGRASAPVATMDGSATGSDAVAALRAEGTGRSKQEAQQAAAAAVLALMDRDQG
ncbi:MAG: ribonuclease [Thermoleophilia bacterium]|nr:ribonuclease [Thermoleophilia bacterium]